LLQVWPRAHEPQEAPPVPHELPDWLPYASQVPLAPPTQQPLGHVFASQVHVPLVVSQSPLPHAAQAAPPVPHEDADSELHASHVPVAPPLQHPVGHEVASQTQVPLLLLHSRPAPHAPQLAPAAPQDALDSEAQASHVPVRPPLQQPCGHELASQTHWPVAVLHSLPAAHAPHAAPPAPHELLLSMVSASHVVPLQQPEHAPPPHVQAPLEQA
jgi:hypothetical protein